MEARVPSKPRLRYNIEHEVPLSPFADFLRVRIQTRKGNVVNFVVQYETLVGDKWYRVVRYDLSHGFAHRDTLDARGRVVDKMPLEDRPSNKEALRIAYADRKENWRRYQEEFLERMT